MKPVSRMPTLGGLAVALALGLALWWAWPGAPAEPDAMGVSAAPAEAASAASDAAPGAAWALLDQASRQADASQGDPALRPTNVCGFGSVRYRSERPEDQQDIARADQWQEAALQGPLMRQLAASPRVVDRVTAAILRGEPDRAAELARQGQDPRAYALAFSQCSSRQGPGCASLSAVEWAAREPDNAVPWWHVAVQALQQGDALGTQQALLRAEAATRALDSRGLMQSSLAAAHAEDATPLMITAIGMEPAVVHSWVTVMARDCSRESARQGPLRQACEALAGQLVHRAPGLMTRVAVASKARRVRMPNMPDEAGVERLRQAWRFGEAQRLVGGPDPQDIGCAVTRSILKWETGLAAHGEAEAIRRAGGPAF